MKNKGINIILKFFFLTLPFLAVTGLTSCVYEDFPEDNVKPGEEDNSTVYFSMSVTTNNADALADLAPEYEDGTEFEHAIDISGNSEHVVIFLDDDYSYRGYARLEFDHLSAQGTGGLTNSQEAVFIGFLRPDFHDAYVMPRYGVMVINASDITTSLKALAETATIRDVLELIDRSDNAHTAGRSGNYFTLSSSAYLVKESNEWKHSIIFEIDKDKTYPTRNQAALTPAAVAYVERMASKFSLKVSGGVGGNSLNFRPDGGRAQVIVCNYVNGEPNYNNRTWNCTVTGWGINKFETEEYFFRNIIGPTTDTKTYPFSYGEDISSTNHPFFNGWNRTVDRRSFWAVDPHYETGIYPEQYRYAVDNTEIEYFGKLGPASLGYVSYNELSADFSKLFTDEHGVSLYSTENTIPDTRLGARWQHDLAASQVVIGAQIHISSVNENNAGYDLYRNRLGIFFPSTLDFATYFISTFNDQLTSQSNMSYRYYDWNNISNNGSLDMRSERIDYDNYRLYYNGKPLTPEIMASLPTIAMPAYIENGDGKVIPWVQGMYVGRRAVNPDTYEEYGDVIKLNMTDNQLKSLIFDWIGPFDHFNKGRMVYSVPIYYRATEEQVSSNKYRPTLGDFGVLRNAWYNFDLQNINTLGNPVDDLNQKIIPYEASIQNSLMMEVKVIDWHEFSTTVVLPGTKN